ncbi:MAG: PQQ-binding-like beta-propeller repeat protein [Myxococcales bacterium]
MPGTWDVSDAPTIAPLWTQDLGLSAFSGVTQPIVAGDFVYATMAGSGHVAALDLRTGAIRWIRDDFNPDVSTTCGGVNKRGFWAAPAVSGDAVYVAAPDGNVYALRKTDGSTIWSSKVADGTPAGHGEFVQSSPTVATGLGKLYLGVASNDGCDEVAGRILSVDLATGASQTSSLVSKGQQGAGIWSSISVDEDAGLLFASTANRIGPISAEPLAQAIVSFDARTLAVVDHWQNPTTLEDSDFGSSPTLFEASDGTKLVAAASKDGWLYVLRRDRLSAGPVWKTQLAVVDPRAPSRGGDPSQGFGSIVSPTFTHGMLYAASGRTPSGDPGAVVAFDPATGAARFRHVTPGYVIAAMPSVGDLLVVESTTPDNQRSWLEILDARDLTLLRRFDGPNATFASPSIGHGVILWMDALGRLTALAGSVKP